MMKLSDICIQRPVLAIVLNLILVLIGLSGYSYLETRFFPKFESNRISVSANFPGASAALVETAVTHPLEEAISTVSGIDTMTSQSIRGSSNINIKLQPNVDINETANQIRNQVSAAQHDLPNSLDTPTVQVGWNQNELIEVAFVDTTKTPEQIRDYLERYIINTLLQVPGLANTLIDGSQKYAVRITLNPDAMAAHHININTIKNALENSNIEMPTGRIKSKQINYPVTAKTAFKNLKEFRELSITHENNNIVHLKDIANVHLGAESDDQALLLINGQPGVALELYMQDDASAVKVAKAVHHLLKTIEPTLPKSMKMIPYYDNSTFLKQAIHEVYETIGFAILFVLIAIFLFLGNWRAIIIPIATIPICLMSTFAVMFFFGFTLNVITLLALVLSIGLVVDDAIVMLENIHRYLEKGLPATKAALFGSRQIAFAIIGMTISLAAVYIPVGFIHTRIAIIFREFAYTLSGAVLISGFVALTLSPMMCSRLLRQQDLHGTYIDRLEHFFDQLKNYYCLLLNKILIKRRWVVTITLILAMSGGFLFKSLPTQFMPPEDMGFVMTVLNTPTGANFDAIKQQAILAEKVLKNNPNIESTAINISDSTNAFNRILIVLKPYAMRLTSATKIAEQINDQLTKVPGLDAFVFAPSPFSGASHQDLEFTLITSDNYTSLYRTIEKIKTSLAHNAHLNEVNSNMMFDSQQYEITVNRELAASMDINIHDIDDTLSTLLGSYTLNSKYNHNDYSYDIVLQADNDFLHGLDSINKFYLTNSTGQLVPLGNLVSIHPVVNEEILPHYNQLRSAEMSAQLIKGYTLGQAMNYLTHDLSQILPENTQFVFSGMAKKLQENNNNMLMIFSLSLIFIYLILAALFESFIDPLIILLTIPICIVGALAGLKLFHGSLNIYTDIGIITLIGLVSKHGILITQFINEMRQEGKELTSAILEGASIRLRPILMTTAAMVFGTLPLIFTSGASHVSRMQIGIVIVSGLLVGTFFSLLVVPVAYFYLARFKPSPLKVEKEDDRV